ncbi:MAG: hypothetical protein HY655_05100 [Acidobacteria bacterium]|nr:hypothetical protein [Acidobacteriota bacterium]
MRLTFSRVAAVAFLLGAWTVAASSQDSAQVFRSRTDLVTVTATITDRAGRPVTTLRREDLTVLEDGKRQEVVFFAAGVDTPLSIGLVVDTSGSMVDTITVPNRDYTVRARRGYWAPSDEARR